MSVHISIRVYYLSISLFLVRSLSFFPPPFSRSLLLPSSLSLILSALRSQLSFLRDYTLCNFYTLLHNNLENARSLARSHHSRDSSSLFAVIPTCRFSCEPEIFRRRGNAVPGISRRMSCAGRDGEREEAARTPRVHTCLSVVT